MSSRTLRRTGPRAQRLEPRMMFDGAAPVDVVAAAQDAPAQQAAPHADAPVEVVAPPAVAAPRQDIAEADQRAADQIRSWLGEDHDQAVQRLAGLFGATRETDQEAWTERAERLLGEISDGTYAVRVQEVGGALLGGAYAAFAAEGPDGTPTILVNADWWASHTDADLRADVLVEEYGHSIDHILNRGADTAGDEGEAFAHAVAGRSLSTLDVARIAVEDDSAVVTIDGQDYTVERASFSFVNAYEVEASRTEAGKESNTHDFDYTAQLGVVKVDDDEASRYFSGNDVSAIGFNIGGTDYFGWISRPIKAQGIVRGFYFWTDADFVDLATAQADGNADGDRNVGDNRAFVLVVDQAYFDSLGWVDQAHGIKNVGSSSDKVDSALNALIQPNIAPSPVNDSLTMLEDGGPGTGNVLTNDSDVNFDTLSVTGFSIGGASGTLDTPFVIAGVGTFTLSANGAYGFTPAANYAGPVPAITYTVADGNGGTATATLSISITPVNDAPAGSDATVGLRSDQTHAFAPADFGFSDPTDVAANRLASVVITTLPASGALTLDGVPVQAGDEIAAADLTKLVYTPAGAQGASFTFQVRDDGGTANGGINLDPTPRTLTLSVTAANQAPVAVNDTAEITQGTATVTQNAAGGVLTNDTTDDSKAVAAVSGVGAASVSSISGTATVEGRYGSLQIADDGSYTYTLDNGLPAVIALRTASDTLTETFTYTVTDQFGLTATATLTITIRGANDAPVAADDADVAKETDGGTIGFNAEGNVLDNDSDADGNGETKSIVGLSESAVGNTPEVVSANTTITLTGSPGSNVVRSVVYYMVGGVKTFLVNASATVLSVSSYDAATMRVQMSGLATNTIPADVVLHFTNNTNSQNDITTAVYGSSGSKVASASVILDDTTGIAAGMTVTGTGIPAGTKIASIDYATRTITLADAANAPVSVLLGDNATLSFAAAAGATLSGQYGTLVLGADGAYVYTPTAGGPLTEGQSAVEAFTYTMQDAAGATSSATLTITVLGSGSDPDAQDDVDSIGEDSVGTASGTVVTNDSTSTGSITVVDVRTPQSATGVAAGSPVSGLYGTLTIDANGAYSYDLNEASAAVQALAAGQTLTDTFVYRISNGSGQDVATLTITIDGANDAPSAAADSAIAQEAGTVTAGRTATGAVLLNDTDTDTGTSLTVSKVEAGSGALTGAASAVTGAGSTTAVGQYGTLVIAADGTYTYTVDDTNPAVEALNASDTLAEDFRYAAFDGTAEAEATLTITIHGANDAPAVTVPATPVAADEGQAVGLNGLSVADVDDGTLTLELSVDNGILTFGTFGSATFEAGENGSTTITLSGSPTQLNAALATLSYTSASGFSGTDALRLTVIDSGDLRDTATLDIAVAADDRALTVTGTTVNEASPYSVFRVTGATGQSVSLSLAETGSGAGHASLGLDVLPALEYFDGTTWQAYTGAPVTIPAGDDLLVRGAVLQDSLSEGSEALRLVATNAAGSAFQGDGAIVDDGTGSIFLAGNTTFTADVAGGPTYLDDDRVVTVNSVVVNEVSPYAVFTVNGSVGQILRLDLVESTALVDDGIGTTATDGSEDFGGGLEVYTGGGWVAYTPGTDLTLTGTTLLVRTPIHDDGIFEGQEAFQLAVTRQASGSATYGTGSIYDDGTGSVFLGSNTTGTADGSGDVGFPAALDDDRSLAVDSPVVNEASDTVIFTLSGDAGQTVSLALANGTAAINTAQTVQVWDGLDWVDYDPSGTPPTFDAAGKIYVRVDIRAEQDSVFEGGETFVLSATLAGRATAVEGTATIRDDGTGVIHQPQAPAGAGLPPFGTVSTGLDDDTPSVTHVGDGVLPSVGVTEGQAAVFTVTLSNASTGATTYALSLSGGTATLGADFISALTFGNGVTYNAGTGLITVPAGVTSFTVNVPTVDDSAIETAEGFTLEIGSVSAGGAIADNDSTAIGSVSSPSVTEGQTAVFTVGLTTASLQAESFALVLSGGTATLGSDFTSAMTFSNGVTYDAGTCMVTVPAGVTSFTVSVPTTDDTTIENSEGFTLQVGGVSGSGSIADNDSAGVGSVSSPSVTEGQTAVFTVGLTGASPRAETFALVLSGGTASLGSDFTSALTFSNGVTYDAGTGLVTVPAGVTSFTVNVPTVDDTTVENNEGFTLQVGGVSGSGAVADNDSTAVGAVSAPSVTEGQTAVFTVGLTTASPRAETFALVLSGGTASLGSDFTSAMTFSNGVTYDAGTGLITVPAGVTSFTVNVPTIDDMAVETSEAFTLQVGGVSGSGSIADNDASVAIGTVSSPSVVEGTAAVFTVSLTAASPSDEAFSLALAGGSATLGSDFTAALTFTNGVTYDAATGLITVPAGVKTFTVAVPTVDDSRVEEAETLSLRIGTVGAVARITDNDVPPTPPSASPVSPPAVVVPPIQVAVPPQPAPPAGVGVVVPEREAAPTELADLGPGPIRGFTGGFPVRVDEVAAASGVHDLRVDKGIPDLMAPPGDLLQYIIPVDAFVHTDADAEVQLSAVMLDGTDLPAWLSFDPAKGEFVGQPPAGLTGELQVKVIARDDGGRQAETILRIRLDARADQRTMLSPGRSGLTAQLRGDGVLAWKAERDLLVAQARAAARVA